MFDCVSRFAMFFGTLVCTAAVSFEARAQDPTSSRWCPGSIPPDESTKGKGTLVVVVPGLDDDTDTWHSAIDALSRTSELKDAAWLCFDHGISAVSRVDLRQATRGLSATIDARFTSRNGFEKVVLVAHSAGGTFAISGFLHGLGKFAGEHVEVRPWTKRVERIVLLGGVTRGIELRGAAARVSVAAERVFGLEDDGFVFQQLLVGAPYATNVRLSWMHYSNEQPTNTQIPIVQLIGERDDVVRVTDAQDFEAFPRVCTRIVPGATHSNITALGGTDNPADRLSILKEAISGKACNQQGATIRRASVKQVAILLHGIRSGTSGWPTELARLLEGRDSTVAVIYPDYGFFSANAFLSRSAKQRNIKALLDAYARALRLYPDAKVHFVGHSNGTYLLGEALRLVPALRFDRVVLAGSVMRSDYNWRLPKERAQVDTVVNMIATKDLTVAVLTRVSNALGVRDVGAAGVDGFRGIEVFKVEGIPGGHDAVLSDSSTRAEIARFILGGGHLPCTDSALCGIAKTSTELESTRKTGRWSPVVIWPVVGWTAASAVNSVYGGCNLKTGCNRSISDPDWSNLLIWYASYRAGRFLLSTF